MFATLLTMNVIVTSALAAETPNISTNASVITPQAEETQCVFRNYNGVVQKRFWSLTYARWLTEWTNV